MIYPSMDCSFSLTDFLPFGIGEGDIVSAQLQDIDGTSSAINLSVPIILGLKEHQVLYVRN